MAEQIVSSLMYRIGALREELDTRASSLLRERRIAFQEVFIRSPRSSPPELAFYQVITWLYGFYYEAGRTSLSFLNRMSEIYGLDMQGIYDRHYRDVRYLRTYLQHNLNLESKTDIETQRHCEDWFYECCGSAIPGAEAEWNDCLSYILLCCIEFLSVSIECVRAIERDEAVEAVTQQWLVRLKRYHPPHEFERLVAVVVHDIGQDTLDVGRITSRYYDRWSGDLLSRSVDYVFEEEARKLIEQTILSESDPPLPISASDIMRTFGFPPGPDIGRLLRIAKVLYLDKHCNKAELLNRLKDPEELARHS